MKKFLLLIFFFVLSSHYAGAQEKSSNPWMLTIGYSRINNHSFTRDGNLGELSIGGNRLINKLFDVGMYAGYSSSKSQEVEPIYDEGGSIVGSATSFAPSQVLLYGISSNFYLSSLFFKDDFDLGLRIIMKPGGFYMFSDDAHIPKRGHYFSFRVGAGIDYKLFRKMGVFGEYSYGFGDGKYRAIKGGQFIDTEVGYKNHIGSFSFGIKIYL